MCDYHPPQPVHAYYFTTSGNQIGSPRIFSVDNVTNRLKNHGDESTISMCSKKYPSGALKDSTYMFFMVFFYSISIVMDSILLAGVKGKKVLQIH